ncbi:MAG TPA: class I SAM-dependent methyltransferase [Sedimentisphaerales bacterium]|nr:class I SAM-dependent methyltransferase [Sedimentisphaerales bacterium]
MRLPTPLLVGTLNTMRLLSARVRPGMRYLEIGCAPGKTLAWVAARCRANVVGLDYSAVGIATCKTLFNSLGLSGELYCEDVLATSLPESSFDFVFSNGVIEHFERPEEIVRAHWKLLKPGAKALIVIPNYRGIYGRLQRLFDAENLKLHNLRIMEPDNLRKLIDPRLADWIKTYPTGRISPGLISWEQRLWQPLARLAFWTLNFSGLLQPVQIDALCPNLVLEFVRKAAE